MSRPKQDRKISNPPLMQGFKPFGIPRRMLSQVSLLYDEYEAIRLLDYEGMNQDQAAVQMNVSRPTLTRKAEGRMAASSSAPMNPSVSGVSGVVTTT